MKARPPSSPVPSLKLGSRGVERKVVLSKTARAPAGPAASSSSSPAPPSSAPPKRFVPRPASTGATSTSGTTSSAAAAEGPAPVPGPSPPPQSPQRKQQKQTIRTTPNARQIGVEIEKLTRCSRLSRLRVGDENTLDVRHQMLGDQHMEIVLRGLGSEVLVAQTSATEAEEFATPYQLQPPQQLLRTFDTMILRDNRLTDVGFERILHCIRSDLTTKNTLTVLDISENSIRRKGLEELCSLLKLTPTLVKLTAEKMSLGDTCTRSLAQSLEDSIGSSTLTLTSLNLSSNKIGDVGAAALAQMLKKSAAGCSSSSLTELDLGWNEIRSRGAVAIFGALQLHTQPGQGLVKLDLSYNAIGGTQAGDQERAAAKALSAMLASNSALLHLDLSQNQLSMQDCATISVGLATNHSLMGLHMVGNAARTDAYGMLAPDAEKWPLESAHSMTRILGSKVQGREKWAVRYACWICGCFREQQFQYTLLQRDVAAVWEVIQKDPNAMAAIHAAERAGLVKKQKEEAAARAADPLYDLLRSIEQPTLATKSEPAPPAPQTTNDRLKPLPEAYPVVVQVCTSFDGWLLEPMSRLGPDEHDHPGTGHDDDDDDKEGYLRNRLAVGLADEKGLLVAVSRERQEQIDRRGSPFKHQRATPKRERGGVSSSPAPVDAAESNVTEGLAPSSAAEEEQQQEMENDRAEVDEALVDSAVHHGAPADAPEANVCVESETVPADSREGEGEGEGEGDVQEEDSPQEKPESEAEDGTVVQESDEAQTETTTASPLKKSSSGKYRIFRMVPPGVHYFCFSVNNGLLQYDPWQPHVPSADLLLLGLKVPAGVQLPAYVNTTRVPEATDEERLAGISSFVSIKARPRAKNTETLQLKKIWTLKDSLFHSTQPLYEEGHQQRCFQADWAQMRAAKGRDKVVAEQLQGILSRHFSLLRRVFETYSVLYSTELFFMGAGAFNELCSKCEIMEAAIVATQEEKSRTASITPALAESLPLPFARSSSQKRVETMDEAAKAAAKAISVASSGPSPAAATATKPKAGSAPPPGKGATRTELELIFVSNTITGPRHEANSKRALARFQFLDCLCQIAVVKFVKTGLSPDAPRALKRLIDCHIEPLAEYERQAPGADFRHKYMLTEEVDIVFKRNSKAFQRAFRRHSGLENSPLEAKTCSFKEWGDFCEHADLAALGLVERAKALVYVRAKATPRDPFDETTTTNTNNTNTTNTNGNAYKQLDYLEFLNAVARAALAIKTAELERDSGAGAGETGPNPIDLVEVLDSIALRC